MALRLPLFLTGWLCASGGELCGSGDACLEVGGAVDHGSEADDEATFLAIHRKLASQQPYALPPEKFSGSNHEIDYTYSFETDCYNADFSCPSGTWCQVEQRPNWYPWDVSYMNRGRCLPYAAEYGACEAAFEGKTAFPRKEDGTFFERPVHCGPEDEFVCTGGDFAKVLPPMCVKRRSPEVGCMSSQPKCAGRGINDTAWPPIPGKPQSLGECPERGKDFCVCPPDATRAPVSGSSCLRSSIVCRSKLEQCGSVFNSFNGPSFAFEYAENDGLPNDANLEAGDTGSLGKLALRHGPNADLANGILKTLWPFPLCDAENGIVSDCTAFPLPVTMRDEDGGLLDNYTNGEPADFLPEHGRGVTDYHCSWMIMHTLSFNGPPVLTAEEVAAFGSMIMYVSGQFDCKVCRNHFASIVEMYGLPSGSIRETYARWLWRAHNIANEHTYATHSASSQQIEASRAQNEQLSPYERRSSDWGNPNYEHPWFMTFADALALWSNVPGTKQ